MTREQKIERIMQRIQNINDFSDISIDILFGFLHDQGGKFWLSSGRMWILKTIRWRSQRPLRW